MVQIKGKENAPQDTNRQLRPCLETKEQQDAQMLMAHSSKYESGVELRPLRQRYMK